MAAISDSSSDFLRNSADNYFVINRELEPSEYLNKILSVRSNSSFKFHPDTLVPQTNGLFILKVNSFNECFKISDSFMFKNNDHYEFKIGKHLLIKRTFIVNNTHQKISAKVLKKLLFFLRVQESFVVIVHYVGDVSQLKAFPHGNRTKHLNRLFRPTALSTNLLIKDKIKSIANDNKPRGRSVKKLYSELKSSVREEGDLDSCAPELKPVAESVKCPRDKKQVENFIYNLKAHLVSDEITATRILILSGLQEHVKLFKIHPHLQLIFTIDEAVQLVNSMMSQFKDTPIEFNLDSTYDLCSYFVTFLSTKNLFLENEPALVVAVFIHEKRTKDDHKVFIEFFLKALEIKRNAFFSTDRELAIINPLNEALNEAGFDCLLFCQRHLHSDIDYWADRQISLFNKKLDGLIAKIEKDSIFYNEDYDLRFEDEQPDEKADESNEETADLSAFKNQRIYSLDDLERFKEEVNKFRREAKELVYLTDLDEYSIQYEEKYLFWNDLCRNYFDNCIDPAISSNLNRQNKHDLREQLIESKRTTNLQEGLNNGVKIWVNYQKLPLDLCLYEIYRYQCEMLDEFNRAIDENGSEHLKGEFSGKLKRLNFRFDGKVSTTVKQSRELFELYETKNKNLRNSSLISIANAAVSKGLIHFVEKVNAFVVESPFNNTIHVTKYFNGKLTCSCLLAQCFHKLAVELVTGRKVKVGDLNVDLTKVHKTLNKTKRSGAKRSASTAKSKATISKKVDFVINSFQSGRGKKKELEVFDDLCNSLDVPESTPDDLAGSPSNVQQLSLAERVRSKPNDDKPTVHEPIRSKPFETGATDDELSRAGAIDGKPGRGDSIASKAIGDKLSSPAAGAIRNKPNSVEPPLTRQLRSRSIAVVEKLNRTKSIQSVAKSSEEAGRRSQRTVASKGRSSKSSKQSTVDEIKMMPITDDPDFDESVLFVDGGRAQTSRKSNKESPEVVDLVPSDGDFKLCAYDNGNSYLENLVKNVRRKKLLTDEYMTIYLQKLRVVEKLQDANYLIVFPELFFYDNLIINYFEDHQHQKIDTIFVICNTTHSPGSHWFLGVINLTDKNILILDSARISKAIFNSNFKRLAFIGDLYLRTTGVRRPINDWNFYLPTDTPNQGATLHCGVYCLEFFRQLVLKNVDSKIDPAKARKEQEDIVLLEVDYEGLKGLNSKREHKAIVTEVEEPDYKNKLEKLRIPARDVNDILYEQILTIV